MNKTLTMNRMIMLVMLAIIVLGISWRQAFSQPPVSHFNTTFVQEMYDDAGDIEAEVKEKDKSFVMVIRRTGAERPRRGWGGACIFSGRPVDLRNLNKIKLNIQSSTPVQMEVKLEKEDYRDGTLWIDRKALLNGRRQTLELPLKGERVEDTSRRQDTLTKVEKLCLFVNARGFPKGAEEVTIQVFQVQFQ